MDKNELSRKKKIQATTSIVGSTLGLSALGTKGGAVVLRRLAKPAAKAKHARDAAKLGHRAQQLDRASLGLVTTASGVGGLSGYNFASIQREEAKREKAGKALVAKADDPAQKAMRRRLAQSSDKEKSQLREEARAVAVKQNKAAKPAKTKTVKLKPLPKSGGINPERRRRIRQAVYTPALAAASGATGAVAYQQAKPAAAQFKIARSRFKNARQGRSTARLHEAIVPGSGERGIKIADKLSREGSKAVKTGLKLSRKPAVVGAAAAGLGAAAIANESHRRRGGKSYNGWWDH